MAQHISKNELLKKAFASAVAFATLACSVPFSPLNINSGALPTNSIVAEAASPTGVPKTYTNTIYYYDFEEITQSSDFDDLEEGDYLFFAPNNAGITITKDMDLYSLPDGTGILTYTTVQNESYYYAKSYGNPYDLMNLVTILEDFNFSYSELKEITEEEFPEIYKEKFWEAIQSEIESEKVYIKSEVEFEIQYIMSDEEVTRQEAEEIFKQSMFSSFSSYLPSDYEPDFSLNCVDFYLELEIEYIKAEELSPEGINIKWTEIQDALEKYTEEDIENIPEIDFNAYVIVKENGQGFDGCPTGGLINAGTAYYCCGGGVQNLEGKTYKCKKAGVGVRVTPGTLTSETVRTYQKGDKDIEIVAEEGLDFEYTDYEILEGDVNIPNGDNTIEIVIKGVKLNGVEFDDQKFTVEFDYYNTPLYTYADQKDMDVVFSKDFKKATLTVTSDDGEFTNVVVLDSAIEGDNQVVSVSDPACEASGKIERVCSTDCTEVGDVLYRATFILNGDEIVYDKPFADGVYGDHKLIHHAAVDNGCKTDGNKEYWECETCGKLFSDADAKTETTEEDVTVKQAHTWVQNKDAMYKVSDTPDCECGYEYYYSCSICGEASTETFFDETSAPGHLFKKRTFKWSSKTDYDECTMELPCQRDDCDFVLKYTAKEGEYQGVDAFGNTYTGSITSDVTSDCTKEGEITYYATFLIYDNGEGEAPSKYTAKIVNDFPAIGHDLVYMEAKAATCTEKGNKAGYYCNTCHKGFADAECKEEIKDFTIPKLGHHTVKIDGVSATCTEDGVKECLHCETCDKYFTDSTCQTEINDITEHATGHKLYLSEEELLAHTQFVWNKEELEKSYAVIKCDECGDAAAIICDYVDADIENVKDATCQQRGFDSYNAEFYNEEYNITVNGSLLINKDKLLHKYDKNGVCESCGMHVADVSIEKDGDYISSGKLRVKYFANSVCNDENYEIVKTGVQYSTDFVNFKEGSKDKVSKYEANVADYGDGNAVIPFVIVKNKKDGTTFRIDGEQVNGYYTKPELQIVKNGDYISSGKNRVKFTISPTLLPNGYTIMKTGVYYNNDEGNATAEFDKDTWKTASKSDSKYEVNVLDKGYGVSLKGYAVIKRIDGSEFTIETDVMHGEYTRPEISIKSESVITADKKNRVKLSFNTEMPKEGYTVLESGICYVNNAANTIYTFDKAKAASFDAKGAASAYVEVADNHYGITAQAYIKVADLSGNQFTFTTDIIHTTFKAPAN